LPFELRGSYKTTNKIIDPYSRILTSSKVEGYSRTIWTKRKFVWRSVCQKSVEKLQGRNTSTGKGKRFLFHILTSVSWNKWKSYMP